MTARAKFLFDHDFARGDAGRGTAVSLAQHQTAIAEAEARGFQHGLAKAAADTERLSSTALARAAEGLELLARSLRTLELQVQGQAVEIAVATARKLAPSLIEREPIAEIEALAADCFRQLVNAPHVVVRVNDAIFDAARERLAELAERSSLGARLIVLAAPEVGMGDCRIEWADGGVKRCHATIDAAIVQTVRRYLDGATLNGSGAELGAAGHE